MPETYFIADHHFHHQNILKMKNGITGDLLRPDFVNIKDMNEFMIEQHNQVVQENDIVWFLGDVMWIEDKAILPQLNGIKNLCVGNHDDIRFLLEYFEEVTLWKKFPEWKLLASHVPIPSFDLHHRTTFNIHGHIHENDVLKEDGTLDWRYLNVGVEKMGYCPIHIEDALFLLVNEGEKP